MQTASMRPVAVAVLCLALGGLLAVACQGNGSESTPTPHATYVGVPGPKSYSGPQGPGPEAEGFMPPEPVTGVEDVREALLQGHAFQLEVARTPSERARGFMERTSLPEDAAMLFVYENEQRLNFWMKNTLIPLDILFLNAQGVVVDVQTMHTQIGVPDGDLEVYRSALPARYALEMNAGLAETLGIGPGAQVLFR